MNKRELMESLSEVVGGTIVKGKMSSGPYLVIPYKEWVIVFDYHLVHTGQTTITYTRVRTVFKQGRDYTLKLSHEGFFSKVGKAFGGQDIEIGDEIFDADHIIKSSDELMTTRLLNTFEIKSRINFKKSFALNIQQKNSMGLKCLQGESGIIFYKTGKIKHEVEVINLIELFQQMLEQLVEMGIAQEGRVSTQLYKEKNYAD